MIRGREIEEEGERERERGRGRERERERRRKRRGRERGRGGKRERERERERETCEAPAAIDPPAGESLNGPNANSAGVSSFSLPAVSNALPLGAVL